MTTERRVSDRRVSLAVTEYAALECERLRAELDLLTEGYPGIAHDFETTIQDNERLRAVNAELVAALQVLADLPMEAFGHNAKTLNLQPLMGWNEHTLTVGHVRAARAALAKAQP